MKTKVFNKGQVVIPSTLRKKYGIEVGEKVEVLDEKEGIRIIPIKNEGGVGKLQGIFSKYAKGTTLTKKDIEKSTERGFTEGTI